MNADETLSGKRHLGVGILSASCLAFGVAMSAPIFSVLPGAGELTPWLRAIKPEAMAEISQSLLSGISILWSEGDLILAILLAFFCVALPTLKFAFLWSSVLRADMESSALGRLVAASSKYSMVEILILAILALVIKGLPGGSTLRFEPAAWFFMASVVLSFLAAELLKGKKSTAQ